MKKAELFSVPLACNHVIITLIHWQRKISTFECGRNIESVEDLGYDLGVGVKDIWAGIGGFNMEKKRVKRHSDYSPREKVESDSSQDAQWEDKAPRVKSLNMRTCTCWKGKMIHHKGLPRCFLPCFCFLALTELWWDTKIAEYSELIL